MKTHTNLPHSAVLFGALVLGLAPALASATTYYVKPDGDDTAAGTSWDTAFRTPAKGFSAVNAKYTTGLELVIASGIYELTDAIGCTGGNAESTRVLVRGETGNPEDVVLRSPGDREVLRLAKKITIASLTLENGSNNGSKDFSGVRIGSGESETASIVSNCVIRACRNNYATSDKKSSGAAAYLWGAALLVDCVVSNNTALFRGPAVALAGASATALRCTIVGNVATNAATSGATVIGINGGRLIDCIVSNNVASVAAGALNVPVVSGCTFENNRSLQDNGGDDAGHGGGLTVDACDATISDCIFRGNTSDYGAGADIVNHSVSFTNCLFEGNVARYGGGGAVVATGSNVSFDDCRFLGNVTTDTTGGNNYGGGGLLLYKQTTAGWCSVSNSVFGSNETGGRGGAFSHEWNAYCQAAIENCIFTNNVSYRQGGAICLREDSSHKHTDKVATIRNCLVVGNRTTGPSEAAATAGGILLVTYNDVEVANCTVVSNVASYVHNTNSGGGIYQRWGGRVINCINAFNKYGGSTDDADSWTSSSGTFLNCCSYPNMPSLLTTENGCINVDPKFTDAENDDFTLKRSSPCRNAGRSLDWMAGAFDLSGAVARISESNPDIGCYEIPQMSTHTVLIFH